MSFLLLTIQAVCIRFWNICIYYF